MVNSLRPYQARVVNSIGSANAIVKMPTGSGKTLVAAELMKRHLQQHPGLACLFLVPTQDLVDQQADVVAQWCLDVDVHVFRFTGGRADRAKHPATERVCIVSTPKACRRVLMRV